MQAHILALHTPWNRGVRSKGQSFFPNVFMLHIKLKEKKYNLVQHIRKYFGPYTHPDSWPERSDIEIVQISIELSTKIVDSLRDVSRYPK